MSRACTESSVSAPESKSCWASPWVNTETHIFCQNKKKNNTSSHLFFCNVDICLHQIRRRVLTWSWRTQSGRLRLSQVLSSTISGVWHGFLLHIQVMEIDSSETAAQSSTEKLVLVFKDWGKCLNLEEPFRTLLFLSFWNYSTFLLFSFSAGINTYCCFQPRVRATSLVWIHLSKYLISLFIHAAFAVSA